MLETVLNCLRAADHVVVFTGADVSAASGIPTCGTKGMDLLLNINLPCFEIYVYRPRHTIGTNYFLLLKEEEMR